MTPIQKQMWSKNLTPKEVSALLRRKGIKLSEGTIYSAMRGTMTEKTEYYLTQVFGDLGKKGGRA